MDYIRNKVIIIEILEKFLKKFSKSTLQMRKDMLLYNKLNKYKHGGKTI